MVYYLLLPQQIEPQLPQNIPTYKRKYIHTGNLKNCFRSGEIFCQYFRRHVIFYFKYFICWSLQVIFFSKYSEKLDENSLYTKLSTD